MSGIRDILSGICAANSLSGVHSPHYEAAMAQGFSSDGNSPSQSQP